VTETRDVNSQGELHDLLAGAGIPVQRWGAAGTKPVADLWTELETGESALTTDSPPERLVSCVELTIRQDGRTLLEVAQLLANGELRERNALPAEKMLPGETPEAAAFRCVEEELGVPRADCRIAPGTYRTSRNTRHATSYPGLTTHYVVHTVEIEVPGLPATEFSTPESDGSGDATIVAHYWDWS
jgi:hypothetical protein